MSGTLDNPQDRALLEAALFVSPTPLTLRSLGILLGGLSLPYVRRLLDEFGATLAAEERGVELVLDATRAMLRVKSQYTNTVAHLAPQQDIGRSVLRSLAVIAYNQPMTQADLVRTRGNKAYAHVQELLERGLIRAEEQGRTLLLHVTREFLRYFGLSSPDEFRFHVGGEALDAPTGPEGAQLEQADAADPDECEEIETPDADAESEDTP
jgi:segregation and condensation protein B